MEVEKKSADVSVQTLWKVFSRRFWILLIVGAVCFALMFTYSKLTFVPKYEATAKMFILRSKTIGTDNAVDDNNYVVAELVAQDCEELLHERVVLETVLEELKEEGLDLNMTWRELEKCMETERATESLNLGVTVTADSPEKAAQIADKICKVGAVKIKEVLLEEHARFYQPSEIVDSPCNEPSPWIMALISAAIMLVLYGVFVFVYVRNDYIGSAAEIQQRLDVVVLGDIPDADKIGKHYGYHYGHDDTKKDVKEKQK